MEGRLPAGNRAVRCAKMAQGLDLHPRICGQYRTGRRHI